MEINQELNPPTLQIVHSFLERQYLKHASHFESDLFDERRKSIAASWFDETTADFWRHARAYEAASLLRSHTESQWLTVGDGRWGLDSIRIRKLGFQDVTPTDICGSLLEESKRLGRIPAYRIENAENLSLENGSFDYVFCKESLHHFPRPVVALYEMMRVASKAVFFVEPNDPWSFARHPHSHPGSLIQWLLAHLNQTWRFLLGSRPKVLFNVPDWETSGNYVYGISKREVEKIALGINLPQIVFKGINDHYIEGCEFEPADADKSRIFREIVEQVAYKDSLCRRGRKEFDLLMLGLMIEPLSIADRKAFEDAGWAVTDLPRNPFVSCAN